MTSMTTEIEVATDPATAFAVFTEEYDAWWGNGPIDSYESWRLTARRIEPGVGGRVVEECGDEERVLGTITAWEPGARVTWTTDEDVTIDVTFTEVSDGTRVTVAGTVPEGGRGMADLAIVRMTPQWLPRHLERQAQGRSHPAPGPFGMILRSPTPAATARWLADTFRLECTGDIPEAEGDPEHTWIEFRVGTGMIALWGGEATIGTDSPVVYVEDLDAHLADTRSAGATIVSPIVEHGFRGYTAEDCEGRQWQFMQAGPRIGR